MKRVLKPLVVLFIVAGCVVFAAALAGGLMDDRAFTQQAKDAAH